jgi:hypothetical protein
VVKKIRVQHVAAMIAAISDTNRSIVILLFV